MKLSESALSRLSSQHLTIAEIVSGIPNERIQMNPLPGKWSIHDNIAHLARYNLIFQDRLQIILATDTPQFPRYQAGDDAEFPQWQKMEIAALLNSMTMERQKIFELAKSISGKDLERIGIHPKYGRLAVADWLEFFLLHEAHHIFTIFQLKNDVSLQAVSQ